MKNANGRERSRPLLFPPSCPGLSRASTSFRICGEAWMAGTSPAMTLGVGAFSYHCRFGGGSSSCKGALAPCPPSDIRKHWWARFALPTLQAEALASILVALEPQYRRALAHRYQPRLRIDIQLGAGVGDVEIAHGELADAIGRREGSVLHLFHAQPLRLIGQVRTLGVEERIVVAAAQLKRDLAGDGARHPALRRFAQHQGLGIEPASLIEQAAETQAVDAVLLDGVLVVDAGDQPFVGNEQQRHAGRFVDAAALGLDDAVLDLVAHAEAMPAADDVGLKEQRHRVGECPAVER